MIDKIPPQNIEAEQRLLAACILGAPADALNILEASDFYQKLHQNIFSAIAFLAERKEPIDAVTIYTELKAMGVDAGGATQISKILDAPVAIDMKHYANIVKACSLGRKILAAAQEIMNKVHGTEIIPANINEILLNARAAVAKIEGSSGYTPMSFSERCMKRLDQYEEFSKGKPFGIKTGFPVLDYLTGGLWGSKLVIIAARPGVGKTAIMMNMARHMASRGHDVGIFSIEMDAEELIDRQISSLSGVSSIRPATGKSLSVEDWKRVNEAVEKIHGYPLTIDDTGGIKIQELCKRIRETVKNGAEIIFIDQLSRIRGGTGRSSYEQNTGIVSELAALKKELKVPICLLAQINRQAEDRPDKKPTISNLKNTGELEESADIILIGHRPYVHTRKEEDRTKAEWELAKHRNGQTANIYMRWDEAITTFQELTTREI
jgi:replicative DNA helicase